MTIYPQSVTLAAETLGSRMLKSPQILLVAGSGFRDALPSLEGENRCRMSEIPNVPCPHVEGHGSDFIWGTVEGKTVLIATGRVHAYEGHRLFDVVFVIRMAHAMGCSSVILTNASGSVDFKYPESSLVIISDQLNLTGASPQSGEDFVGTRFTDMTDCYDQPWRESVMTATKAQAGIYAGLTGPNYETRAEASMLRLLGANMVGMSTVHECTAARALDMKVLGLSFITNMSGGMGGTSIHEDVLKSAQNQRGMIRAALREAIISSI